MVSNTNDVGSIPTIPVCVDVPCWFGVQSAKLYIEGSTPSIYFYPHKLMDRLTDYESVNVGSNPTEDTPR